jgi:hypothetical protein
VGRLGCGASRRWRLRDALRLQKHDLNRRFFRGRRFLVVVREPRSNDAMQDQHRR